MSTQVLPNFAGLGYDVKRSPIWSNTVQSNISGKEVRIGLFSTPRYQWELKYNFLRQGTLDGVNTYAEFESMLGFFNSLSGSLDSFLYQDSVENTATNQGIGIGDGVNTSFQLAASSGSNYVMPILAPNVVSSVSVAGTQQPTNSYTVNNWGTTTPGTIVFNNPPANGALITSNFTYYFPVRFMEDTLNFNQSMSPIWGLSSAKFISLK